MFQNANLDGLRYLKLGNDIIPLLNSNIGLSNFSGLTIDSILEKYVVLQRFFDPSKSLAENLSGSTTIDTSTTGDARTVQKARAYLFDGTDDIVTMSSELSTSGSYFISIWIKPTNIAGYQATYGSGIIKNTNNSPLIGDFIISINSAGYLYFYNWRNAGVDTNGREISTSTLNDDTVYHIICAWDGITNKIYINGVEETLGTPSSTSSGWTTEVALGTIYSPNAAYYYEGHIWDIQVYHRELTADDVTTLYNSGMDGNILSNPDYIYKTDEGDGTTSFDSSGNANHGTIANATLGTFHSEFTDGYGSDYQNLYGYTDNSGVLVPRNENNTSLDAQGNPLQYTGRVPYNGTVTGHDSSTNGIFTVCSIDRNPNGAKKLINAGVPLNDTISYGDDFSLSDPPYDYKLVQSSLEKDLLVLDTELTSDDLLQINGLGYYP